MDQQKHQHLQGRIFQLKDHQSTLRDLLLVTKAYPIRWNHLL